MTVNITKDKFISYVKVQRSGITNMWNVSLVCQLSGLEKDEVLDIMTNYRKYSEIFKITMKNVNEESDHSPEYPLGGMIEPYDIEREKEDI